LPTVGEAFIPVAFAFGTAYLFGLVATPAESSGEAAAAVFAV
jgi:hypothetical protein